MLKSKSNSRTLLLSTGRSRKPRPLTRSLALSVAQGSLHPALERRTLPDYFAQEVLAKHSTRPALICRSEIPRAHAGPPSRNLGVSSHLAWDYEEFERHIAALARGLLLMGVEKGDRVGVLMGNNSSYATLQWAVSRIGAILVTINPAYHIDEQANTLKLVGVKHLFVVPRIRTTSYVQLLADRFPGIRNSQPGSIQEADLPELRNLIVVDNEDTYRDELRKIEVRSVIDWREVLLWGEDTKEDRMVKELTDSLQHEDVINLQFTSGTTGLPKAVSLTHYNLLNNGIAVGRRMYLTEKDILFLGNLAAWTHGSCIVYPSAIFDPVAIVDAVAAEKCTALHGVPTHFLGVLSELEKRRNRGEGVDTTSLRTGIAAGSSIPIELMRRLISELNLKDLTNVYGMTETSPASFQTSPADPIIKRIETVGKILPHVKAKVIDPEGNIVPVGVPGEICIAGYLVQKGYWEDEQQTRKAMHRDSEDSEVVWMHTGDEGILDEEGYLRVVGRIKDIIIRGGENLFPVQIEDALTSNNHKIREAAAVAVPDQKYGEVVGAWIVPEPGTKLSSEEVRQTVARNMNPQNTPAWVWFVGEDGVPDELPKTASGKVMKHVLRKWSTELAEKGIGCAQS